MRAMIIAVVFTHALLPASAAAEPTCKQQQKLFAKSLAGLTRLAEKATDVTIGCLFGGADDKAVTRMAKEATGVYRKLREADVRTTGKCRRRDPELLLDGVARYASERLGFMYGTCSSSADRIFQEKISEGERNKKLESLVKPWLEGILRDAGILAP